MGCEMLSALRCWCFHAALPLSFNETQLLTQPIAASVPRSSWINDLRFGVQGDPHGLKAWRVDDTDPRRGQRPSETTSGAPLHVDKAADCHSHSCAGPSRGTSASKPSLLAWTRSR